MVSFCSHTYSKTHSHKNTEHVHGNFRSYRRIQILLCTHQILIRENWRVCEKKMFKIRTLPQSPKKKLKSVLKPNTATETFYGTNKRKIPNPPLLEQATGMRRLEPGIYNFNGSVVALAVGEKTGKRGASSV